MSEAATMPRFRKFIPTSTTTGLFLIVGLLVANALISGWNVSRLVDNEHRVVRTQEVLTTLEEVLSSVTAAETAERGFLITDDDQYRQSYESAIVQINETLERLTTLRGDDSVQQRSIAALRTHVSARLEELKRAIAARRAGGFDAARQSVSTNHGRELMQEMRELDAQVLFKPIWLDEVVSVTRSLLEKRRSS